jgi:hypothetical protein
MSVIFIRFRRPEALNDTLQDTRGLPTPRKSYKTYQTVGWVVGLGILRENCSERYLARAVMYAQNETLPTLFIYSTEHIRVKVY